MQSKHFLVFFHSFLCLFVFADDFMVYVDFDLQWIVLHFMSDTRKKMFFWLLRPCEREKHALKVLLMCDSKKDHGINGGCELHLL